MHFLLSNHRFPGLIRPVKAPTYFPGLDLENLSFDMATTITQERVSYKPQSSHYLSST